jgi:adenylosuccinate synthase
MKVVVGLGFGDEGKGLTTDFLCSEAIAQGRKPVVIRFNGGHQAGHTVTLGDRRHVFSSFGAGTLRGAQTLWSQYCTLYPTAFLNEHKLLEDVDPSFFAHPLSPITTIYDIHYNRWIERQRGIDRHGSVGVGFGATMQREESHYKLNAKDLYFSQVFIGKMMAISDYYRGLGCPVDEIEKDQLEMFIEDAMEARNKIGLFNAMRVNVKETELIYEGAQGIMLDQDHGFFPNVTRSHCTSRNAMMTFRSMGSGIQPEIWYVTRTYATRHGAGYLPGEDRPIELVNNTLETNVQHDFQGNFRKAPLDPDLINYAIECDQVNMPVSNFRRCLMVTCNDQHELDVDWLLSKIKFKFDRVALSFGPKAEDVKEHAKINMTA